MVEAKLNNDRSDGNDCSMKMKQNEPAGRRWVSGRSTAALLSLGSDGETPSEDKQLWLAVGKITA